jgi:hypothetical protein
LNGTVSKTVVALWATVGSNPTLSAEIYGPVSLREGGPLHFYWTEACIIFQDSESCG